MRRAFEKTRSGIRGVALIALPLLAVGCASGPISPNAPSFPVGPVPIQNPFLMQVYATSQLMSVQREQYETQIAALRDPAVLEASREKWLERVKTRVRSHLVVPTGLSLPPAARATFDVVVGENGELERVRRVESSGNRRYDAAVENALLKSSPLPGNDLPDAMRRELRVSFRPGE